MAQATKIMLVEDDNNLGEIYMARMAAEGYSVVVAHDGEEALAMAAKEKPDLIISDVMMPKISGFEMLDILRNTPGLRDTKVIMLTALGQAEDKTRAQSLGADRYLVKSQVTLEDIVENARALLSGEASGATTTPLPAGMQPALAQSVPTAQPAAPAAPVSETIPVAAPATDPPAAADPPVPVTAPAVPVPPTDTPIAANSAPSPSEALAEPLNAGPESKEPKKTVPIESLIADPAAPQPRPLQMPAPTVTSTMPIAVQPTQTAPLPTVPEQPKPPEPSPAANNAANDKVLTGAVDELLSNAPKSPVQSQTAPPSAVAPAPNPTAENKPSEHAAKVLDDGGNDLAAGDTDSSRVAHKKVIAPSTEFNKKPDLNALLANEEAKSGEVDSMPPQAGITSNNYGIQSTVIMPSQNISDVKGPGAEAQPPASQPAANNANPQSPPPAPGSNFDPNSVAL